MRNHYLLIVLFMFMSGILCNPLPSMLDAIMQNCSLEKSEQNKVEILPELNECQNWNMIISTRAFSGNNKNEIRCLLLFDSFVSMCKEVKSQFIQLLKTEPNVTSAKDVCKYLLNLPQEVSGTVHNIMRTQDVCEYICDDFHNGSIVSNTMCTKSQIFYKLSNNNRISHDTTNVSKQQNILKDTPNLIGATSEIKAKETENTLNNELEEIDGIRATEIIQNNGHELQETPTGEERNGIKAIESEDTQNHDLELEETPTRKEKNKIINQAIGSEKPHSELNENLSQKSINSNIARSKSSTVATNLVNQTQDGQEEIQKTDTGPNSVDSLINEQQAPLMNSNLNDQNTAQGQMYDGDEEISYNTEQGKEQKLVKPEMVQDGNDDIDDDDEEEAIHNKLKAPKISQLSDRFEYDADLSGNSYFFSYFSFTCVVLVIGYVLYHNKQKVIALLVEGRHSRRPQRARRPNSANYHKLDSNLEEAISSSVSKNPSHVIY